MSSIVLIFISAMHSASGIFGVITVAKGTIVLSKQSTLDGGINAHPFLAYMTGSTTIFFGLYSISFLYTASMHTGVDNMPIFTASTFISSNIASICSSIIFGVISSILITLEVFSATTQTTTLIPNTPRLDIVFKSACIPAPPLQSEPAIVNAVFIIYPP